MTAVSRKDNTKAFITIGFLAVFLIMALAMGLSVSTLHSSNKQMSSLITDNAEKVSSAYHMRDAIRMRSNAIKSLPTVTEPLQREEIFKQLTTNTTAYLHSKNHLEALGANTREETILQKVDEAGVRVKSSYEKAYDNLYNVSDEAAKLKATIAEVQLQELVLLNHLNDLVKLEKAIAEETLASNQARYRRTQVILFISILAAFATSMLISGFVVKRVSHANNKIAHLASHDDLTGLNNRRFFEERLSKIISFASRSDDSHGLIYFDLDHFKAVNDTCGHHAGDQLLVQLTNLLQSCLGENDTFARVGGDEFAVIAHAKSFSDIADLAEKLRSIVSDFNFNYNNKTFKVSLSIGAIPIRGDIQDIETILRDVDAACYLAKKSGRNRVHIPKSEGVEVAMYRNDIASMQKIRYALAGNSLELFYQPIYKIEKNSLTTEHCEILLRMRSDSGQLLAPADFIPVAEKYNVMPELDRWVFSAALKWLSDNQHQVKAPTLHINLSGLSLSDESFLNFVVSQLMASDVDPRMLAFDISENAANDDIENSYEFIKSVKAMGCQSALDNFGSGLSAFSSLKQLPIDFIKIDGSLVTNIDNDKVDRALVKAINDIGHTVGAKTIAKSVEDEAALAHLSEMGVDYAQGFGLRIPETLSELAANLEPTNDTFTSDKAA